MNWFVKIAKNFETRNTINHKILYLKALNEKLEIMSKIIFQSASRTKESILNEINRKDISSYPQIRDMLIEAYNSSLDSPWRFSNICKEIMSKLKIKVGELIKERNEIFDPQDKLKGFKL